MLYDRDNTPDDATRFLFTDDCPECGGLGYAEELEGGRCRRVQCDECERRVGREEK